MKAAQDALQPSAAPAEQPSRGADVPRRTLDQFGDTLSVAELAEWRGLSAARIYRLIAEGCFDFALVRPEIGPRLFSRARLQEWADGQLRGLTVARKRGA